MSSPSVLPLTSEALEKLLNQASLARRLARAIPGDPMALRLAQIAEELETEIDRQVQIITSRDCGIQPTPSEECTSPRREPGGYEDIEGRRPFVDDNIECFVIAFAEDDEPERPRTVELGDRYDTEVT